MISGYNSASLLACSAVTFTFNYDESRNINESHFETSFFLFFLFIFSGSQLIHSYNLIGNSFQNFEVFIAVVSYLFREG